MEVNLSIDVSILKSSSQSVKESPISIIKYKIHFTICEFHLVYCSPKESWCELRPGQTGYLNELQISFSKLRLSRVKGISILFT